MQSKPKLNETYTDKSLSDNSLESSQGRKKKQMKRTAYRRQTLDDKNKLVKGLEDIESEQAFSSHDSNAPKKQGKARESFSDSQETVEPDAFDSFLT